MWKFQDYSPDMVFTPGTFAFESEIASYHAADFNAMTGYEWFEYYNANIWEVAGMHKAPRETVERFLDFVKKNYEFHMPWGRDTYLSGGNHFHVFFDAQGLEHWKNARGPEVFRKWHQGLPLFAIPYRSDDGTLRFFQRRNWGARFSDYSSLCENNKSDAVVIKSRYTGGRSNDDACYSLEFRMNQVQDPRLYGYYLGMMLAHQANVNPDSLLAKETWDKLYFGIDAVSGDYGGAFEPVTYCSDCDEPVGQCGCEECDYTYCEDVPHALDVREHPELGVAIDESIVKANAEKLLALLDKAGMIKASAALREYLVEKTII